MQTTRATRSEEGEISMVWKDDGVREDFFKQVRQDLGVWKRTERRESEIERNPGEMLS